MTAMPTRCSRFTTSLNLSSHACPLTGGRPVLAMPKDTKSIRGNAKRMFNSIRVRQKRMFQFDSWGANEYVWRSRAIRGAIPCRQNPTCWACHTLGVKENVGHALRTHQQSHTQPTPLRFCVVGGGHAIQSGTLCDHVRHVVPLSNPLTYLIRLPIYSRCLICDASRRLCDAV
jgi:hypothetical protein